MNCRTFAETVVKYEYENYIKCAASHSRWRSSCVVNKTSYHQFLYHRVAPHVATASRRPVINHINVKLWTSECLGLDALFGDRRCSFVQSYSVMQS